MDNIRFCYFIRESLTEVQNHMALAHDLGYISNEIHARMITQAESVGKQPNNYIAYLKSSKQGKKRLPSGYTIREKSEPYLPDFPEETNH